MKTKAKKVQVENRQYGRYDMKVDIFFRVAYEFETDLRYQILNKKKRGPFTKYPARSRNVSAEGISFTSGKKLNIGDILKLEMYLPERKKPIFLNGSVIWTQTLDSAEADEFKFDTGVKLITAAGQSVAESIYFDQEHQVVWSIVLETILGSFRKYVQSKAKTTKKKA